MSPQIYLGAEDRSVSKAMAGAFGRRGIQIIPHISGLGNIEKQQSNLRLHYDLDGEALFVDAEVIIMAVGWVGNVEQMQLAQVDVEVSHGYIVVDDALRSTRSHIFAAGDITGRMMLVQSATYEGRLAAENAILNEDRSYRHELVPHGGFTDPEYASVGLTESQSAKTGPFAVATVPYSDLDRAVIDGRTEGFCKLIVSPESGLLLGAHVVGEQAVEVVQIAAAGMAANINVRQLAELELAYPTFTAILGLAARRLVHQLGLSPVAPVWRALGRVEARPAEWEIRGP